MTVFRVSTLLFILLATACEEPAPAEIDAEIIIPDGAILSPSDGGTDGGPDAATDGPCGAITDYIDSEFPPLPSSCMPRCTAETAARVAECETFACVVGARSEDPLPAVEVETYWGLYRVSCAGEPGTIWRCDEWQLLACHARVCPGEYHAWATCEGERPRQCRAEYDAITACMETRPEHATCVSELLPLCFPSE